ncbi:sucrase-isomaltase, intestinal-like isoform X1 [Asterias amurensis]|uniref:sucrase-isomaltase, intestinal-like isoform X1 n=1 Tax=Asterias amurensis TaxID=7602 RepID=UPI003AB8218E
MALKGPLIVGLCVLLGCLFLVMLPSMIVTARPYSNWRFREVQCEYSAQNEENNRLDCFPELKMPTERECQARGCCYVDVTVNREAVVPECYLPRGVGYEVMGTKQVLTSGYELYLQRINTPRFFHREAENLVVHIDEQAENRLHVKISEYHYVNYQDWKFPVKMDRLWEPRYEVPIEVTRPARQSAWKDYIFNYTTNPFTMQLTRRISNRFNMIDTSLGALVFEDQFLQITMKLPNSVLYGFGEHKKTRLRHGMNWRTVGMFSAPGHVDDDQHENANLYGHHPFFMNIDDDGNAFGVYFHNSNAMDVHLTPMPAVTWRTTGGILDFYIFTGPTPQQVIQQYQEVIGRPEIPPYWALGLHLGMESFQNADALEKFVDDNIKAGVPFDVVFSGMDYQNYYLTFTHNEEKVRKAFIEDLHSKYMKYAIHLTPALSSHQPRAKFDYFPFYYAEKHGILVNRSDKLTPAFGVSWHGETAYMDFTHEFAKVHWAAFAQALHDQLPFDGIIMTENEPANFVNGARSGCDLESKWNNPPYNAKLKTSMLFRETLCMDSQMAKGINYNLHSLYGHFSAEASNYAGSLLKNNKRAMTLTRASFAGTGQFAGHFLGRNKATWEGMYQSMIGVDEFNMFGIPFTGADICGTTGEMSVDSELCQRWMQLGAYQPLARIFRATNSSRMDPGAFTGSVLANMREMARRRYRVLPYMYTQIYHAHVDGYALVRAPFYDFNFDKLNVWDVDWEYMLGNSLLVAPVMEEGARQVTLYHPDWRFYYFYDPQEAGIVVGSILDSASEGTNITVSAPLNEIPIFIRGGYIIVTQEPGNNTYYSRMNPLEIWVAMPENNEDIARGDLFWDDGETLNTYERNIDIYMEFFADLLKLEMLSQRIGLMEYNDKIILPRIQKVTFVGLQKNPGNQLYVDNVQLGTEFFDYDVTNRVLEIRGIDLDITSDHRIDLQAPN